MITKLDFRDSRGKRDTHLPNLFFRQSNKEEDDGMEKVRDRGAVMMIFKGRAKG